MFYLAIQRLIFWRDICWKTASVKIFQSLYIFFLFLYLCWMNFPYKFPCFEGDKLNCSLPCGFITTRYYLCTCLCHAQYSQKAKYCLQVLKKTGISLKVQDCTGDYFFTQIAGNSITMHANSTKRCLLSEYFKHFSMITL